MPLNIKDEKTYALARTLAERTGLSLTGAVKRALEHELERTKPPEDRERLIADLNRMALEIAAMPTRDNRSPDEIIGYDENGLPQ